MSDTIPALIGNLLEGQSAPRKNPLLERTRHQEILAKVEREFEESKQGRLKFERDWYTNMAFYFGRQWIAWSKGVNGNFSRMHEPPAPPWRVRLVSNKIRPIIRKELAKITKEKPTLFVMPASPDSKDIMGAMAAEHAIEHLWILKKMHKIQRRTVFWGLMCGTSFIKDWFSSEQDEEGIPGKICVEPVSAFHLFVPNLEEEELENQPWVIHALAKTPSQVEEIYGVKLQPTVNASAGLIEQKFMSALGIADTPKKYVLVKEMWIKPCKDYPQGAVIHWANDRILSTVEQWPFKFNDFNFSKFDHIPTGRFYADSVIKDLIPLQKEYNRTRSQIIEAKNRMAKPQLISPRGAVDPRKITSEPGLVIEYTPGFTPPSPLPLQSLPSYVLQELDRNQIDMNDISSQHEVTQGQTPPGVEAATAIAYLQEQDDAALAPTIDSLEECVEKVGKHFLTYMQQFWTVERTVRVVGQNRLIQALQVSSQSLEGAVDLRVESGSATPRSRAAKQAFLMELAKMGILPPDRLLRYLELTESARLYDEAQVDQRQAQRENFMMAGGHQIFPNTWDDHAMHINEHNEYRKSQEFENLPDEIKIIFEQHVQIHQMVAAQMMGGMMPPGGIMNPQLLQQVQGGNGQPGGGPPIMGPQPPQQGGMPGGGMG